MIHKGSCHCGKVSFEIEGEIVAVVSCNCSICRRKGALLWAAPRDRLRLNAGEEDLGRYRFNRDAIEHRFCRTCGMHPFAEETGDAAETSVYVNVRCLDDIDLKTLEVIEFDGRSL